MRIVACLLVALAFAAGAVDAAPEGQMTWGVHTTLVPTYFDPSETIIGPGGLGTAARTLEAYVVAGGPFTYGSYPDGDGLFREQAGVLDRAKREALLHGLQQLVHDKAMFAPMYELAFVNPTSALSGRECRHFNWLHEC